MNLEKLKAELRRDEGFRQQVYLCTSGKKTIGYGHNLEAHGEDAEYISRETAEEWLQEDIQDAMATAMDFVGNQVWEGLADSRQRVLVNMAFCLGNKLFQFKRLKASVLEQNWNQAAESISNSLFARQTGDRAKRLSDMMRNGE
jgi:lysozyme